MFQVSVSSRPQAQFKVGMNWPLTYFSAQTTGADGQTGHRALADRPYVSRKTGCPAHRRSQLSTRLPRGWNAAAPANPVALFHLSLSMITQIAEQWSSTYSQSRTLRPEPKTIATLPCKTRVTYRENTSQGAKTAHICYCSCYRPHVCPKCAPRHGPNDRHSLPLQHREWTVGAGRQPFGASVPASASSVPCALTSPRSPVRAERSPSISSVET